MKKHLLALLTGLSLAMSTPVMATQVTLKEKLAILQKHYPTVIKAVDGNNLILTNGTRLIIDDKQKKSHQDKLKNPDIEDMLSQHYPVGSCANPRMPKNFDPGRIRHGVLFKHLYGQSKKGIRQNLVTINWFGQKLKVTKRYNVHKALIKVRDHLAQHKDLRKYLKPSAGSFNWRFIAGTRRLSVHSFGAAIDLNIKYAHYWRWSGKSFQNRIPDKIIKVFENQGFIWGGKWYHYDTMHFEFRPELIEIGRLVRATC